MKDQTIFLRWLKLTNVDYPEYSLPAPTDIPKDRRIIVPDDSINLLVDMGIVRQPRVSLRDEPDKDGSLVEHLFAVEGFPPGAVFSLSWAIRGEEVKDPQKWSEFLHNEHFLGGLWSVGYGRINVVAVEGGK